MQYGLGTKMNAISFTKIAHLAFISGCFRFYRYFPPPPLLQLTCVPLRGLHLNTHLCFHSDIYHLLRAQHELLRYSFTITVPQPAGSISSSHNDIVLFPESLSPPYLKLNMSCSCSALWFIESTVSGEICISGSFTMDFSLDGCWTLLHCAESRDESMVKLWL